MSIFRRRLGSVLALTLLSSACTSTPETPCPQQCEAGMVCELETQQCVASPRPRYLRDIPGRSAQIASVGDTIWTASVDPSDGVIVVQQVRGGSRDARHIASPSILPERRISLAASSAHVGVAWRNSSDQYELAWRSVTADVAAWNFTTLVADTPYVGAEDFDLIFARSGPMLLFRDRMKSVRALHAATPDGPWNVEEVDDGGTTGDGVTCPESLRTQPGVGVGFDPNIAQRGEQIVAAYYDADCGDLRLARRTAQGWSVTLVDGGDDSEPMLRRSMVGRWPSIAFDAAGLVSVSYQDVSRGRLMIAHERGGRFETAVVDAGFELDAFSRQRKNVVGAFSTLRVEDSGAASIVYFDGTSADLRLATRAAGSTEWSTRRLLNEGAVGFSAGQVMLSSGRQFVGAERLRVSGDGFRSELVMLEAAQ